jgi:hypothetical protein
MAVILIVFCWRRHTLCSTACHLFDGTITITAKVQFTPAPHFVACDLFLVVRGFQVQAPECSFA